MEDPADLEDLEAMEVMVMGHHHIMVDRIMVDTDRRIIRGMDTDMDTDLDQGPAVASVRLPRMNFLLDIAATLQYNSFNQSIK